jgi:N-acetylglucosamine-6-sulfatase
MTWDTTPASSASGTWALAYEESIRLPLLVRYPAMVKAGSQPSGMTLTTDLAPTILDLAGAPPLQGLDGRSFVPLFKKTPADWRRSFLIEYTTDIVFPRMLNMGYDAVRTERYKYIRYRELQGMNELYDLQRDPYELANLIDSPPSAQLRRDLEAQLDGLLGRRKALPARSPSPAAARPR